MDLIIAGYIVTGGKPDSTVGNSVEVFNPATGSHCELPDIPGDERSSHSMCGHLLCGGGSTSSSTLRPELIILNSTFRINIYDIKFSINRMIFNSTAQDKDV